MVMGTVLVIGVILGVIELIRTDPPRAVKTTERQEATLLEFSLLGGPSWYTIVTKKELFDCGFDLEVVRERRRGNVPYNENLPDEWKDAIFDATKEIRIADEATFNRWKEEYPSKT